MQKLMPFQETQREIILKELTKMPLQDLQMGNNSKGINP